MCTFIFASFVHLRFFTTSLCRICFNTYASLQHVRTNNIFFIFDFKIRGQKLGHNIFHLFTAFQVTYQLLSFFASWVYLHSAHIFCGLQQSGQACLKRLFKFANMCCLVITLTFWHAIVKIKSISNAFRFTPLLHEVQVIFACMTFVHTHSSYCTIFT